MGQYSSFSLEDFLPYKLVRTAEKVADSLAALYEKEFGISRPEWRILANLGARENLIARDLSDVTNLDKVKVSRTLAKLEEKGLIVREKRESDQRATQIVLTPEGLALYEKIIPRALQWESEILDGLTGTQYRDLFRAWMPCSTVPKMCSRITVTAISFVNLTRMESRILAAGRFSGGE